MKKEGITAELPRTRKVTILGQEYSQREPTVTEALELQDLSVKIEFDDAGNRSINLNTRERNKFIVTKFFSPSINLDALPCRVKDENGVWHNYLDEVVKAIADWERWSGISAFLGAAAEEARPAGPAS